MSNPDCVPGVKFYIMYYCKIPTVQMTKSAIFLLLLLSAGRLCAQETFHTPWKSVKLYLNYDFANSSGGLSASFADGAPVGRLAPAFSWSGRPRFVHEIGLAALHLNFDERREIYQSLDSNIFEYRFIGGWATTNYQLGLRYELAWKWLDWGHGAFYFGGSIAPFIAKATFESDSPGEYDALEKAAGVHLQGVFRLLFRLGKRWFVDVNTPAGLTLNTLNSTVTRNGNTFDEGTVLNMGMAAGVRLGMGYRF